MSDVTLVIDGSEASQQTRCDVHLVLVCLGKENDRAREKEEIGCERVCVCVCVCACVCVRVCVCLCVHVCWFPHDDSSACESIYHVCMPHIQTHTRTHQQLLATHTQRPACGGLCSFFSLVCFKVVVRHLPPALPEEKFMEIISPFASDISGHYYTIGDSTLGKQGWFAR